MHHDLKREAEVRKDITTDLYRAHAWDGKPTDAPVFVLHDGPPYANGSLHIGEIVGAFGFSLTGAGADVVATQGTR